MHALRLARHAFAALVFFGLPAVAQAPADIRVALVIGNGAYPAPGQLANPVNDATAMAESLKRLGFDVLVVRDGNRADMAAAIAGMRERLRAGGGVGMFYYAGHGLQVDWRNYMLPVDARPRTAADVQAQAVPVDDVIAAFKDVRNRVNIVILDACRDNPFDATATGKGLAQTDAPPGTFLAYATAPGNVAEDGRGSNGLYTGFLLQELARPAARIEDVFKRVRLQVRHTSAGRQIPWESTSLEDDFVFNDGKVQVAPARRPAAAEREQSFAREKTDWDAIKASRNAEDFYAFLLKYPNGSISEAAQERLNTLNRPQVVAAPVKGRNPIVREFHVGEQFEQVQRDLLTGQVTQHDRWRVTSVQDGRVQMNEGELVTTLEGGMVRNPAQIVFDPPLQTVPAGDFQVGHKWTTRSVMSHPTNPRIRGWIQQDMKVAAYEPVTVAAGTFPSYRIEADLATESGIRGTVTSWVSEDGLVLKAQRRARQANGQIDSWDREMVRIQRCSPPASSRGATLARPGATALPACPS